MQVNWSEEAARLRRTIPTDPFVQRYLEMGRKWMQTHSGSAPNVSSPRDAIGEQRFIANILLSGQTPISVPDLTAKRWRRSETFNYDKFGVLLHSAIPYLWENRIHDLAWKHNLPKHIVTPQVPHPIMWWTFEGAVPLTLETGEPLGVLDALLIVHEQGQLTVLAFGSRSLSGAAWVSEHHIAFGSRYPEDIIAPSDAVLRLLAFVNSPYVETAKRLTHDRGTKAKWHGRRIGDPVALNVVALRSSVKEAADVERGIGPRWKQRWLVRGHYRAQWYPSLKAHKVIWIAPYLKGPEDAPLATQTYAVVR